MEGGIGNAEEGIFRFGIVDCGMLNQPPASPSCRLLYEPEAVGPTPQRDCGFVVSLCSIIFN